MSESDGSSFWCSDLDCCISIGDPDEELEEEWKQAALLRRELREIGDLQLLAGKAISSRQLHVNGIDPSEWRHALHKSEMTISFKSEEMLQRVVEDPVTRFIKGMLDLGRPYAIARYARWERVDHPSALTATLPHGIRALVNQLLASETITRTRDVDASIRAALEPSGTSGMTAYHRTGLLQAALHRIADDTPGHPGGARLDRNMMRAMLSLARLYFSTLELRMASIEELRSLLAIYDIERASAWRDDERIPTNGRLIRAWRVRHIQPLVYLYPYSIRHGLNRALAHGVAGFDRTALVNELALAHCGIFRMRAAGLAKAHSK